MARCANRGLTFDVPREPTRRTPSLVLARLPGQPAGPTSRSLLLTDTRAGRMGNRDRTGTARQRTHTRHSCGWLYVEKKVDKLSPGSLKAWAGRSTHSSRPLLFFPPCPSSSFPPSSLTHHHLHLPSPVSPLAAPSSPMLYALFLLHSLLAPLSPSTLYLCPFLSLSFSLLPTLALALLPPCIQGSTTVFLSLLSSPVR